MPAIIWRSQIGAEVQICSVKEKPNQREIIGVVFSELDGQPLDVSFVITTDPEWFTQKVTVQQDYNGRHQVLELTVDGERRWYKNGLEDPGLRGCVYVDLGITPATNSLQIKQLRLEPGKSETVLAAWVRFPALTVEKASQRYSQLGGNRVEYQNGSYAAELALDEDGFIVRYADLWELVGKTGVKDILLDKKL